LTGGKAGSSVLAAHLILHDYFPPWEATFTASPEKDFGSTYMGKVS
ncbi:unnamed protein product, partial [marine sediment metagenome]